MPPGRRNQIKYRYIADIEYFIQLRVNAVKFASPQNDLPNNSNP